MTDKKQTVEEYLKENLIHIYSDEDEAKDVCRITFKALAMARVKAKEKGRCEERKRCDEKIEDAYAGGEQFGRREAAKEIFEAIEKADKKSQYSELPTEYNLIKARFLGKEKEAKPCQ